LPWGGFHPLESQNIMTVLLIAVVVGIVVLLICMALNMVNTLRKRDIHGAFFSPSGLCGVTFYVAALAAIVGAFTGKFSIGAAYIVFLLVLPLILIWIGEPLSKLLEGQKDWMPESVGMFLVEGFFDIFEALLGYMSSTLSFLRLGAYAISHAGMMMVVFMLSENAAATGRIATIILGNIFVAGLEAALSSIQIIRLEFYEMFGRFNSGRGRAFEPVVVEYN
jgi:Archaeal/vacuolar-type H+-ATPase subunit I